MQELIDALGVAPGERVLDVGTGPGVLIPYLRALVGSLGQVCAFDLSSEMVKIAFRKRHSSGDGILRADVHHIPVRSDAVDRVVCFAAFPHFSDPGQAVREMARVLRPRGTLIIAHLLSREELAAHHAGHASVARDVLPQDRKMATFFTEAGLSPPEITDVPGRYLAKASK